MKNVTMKLAQIIICDYGCGQPANFEFKNGKHCCCKYHGACPAQIEKTKKRIKESWTDERKQVASERTKKQWKETDTLSCEETVLKRNKTLKEVWASEELRRQNSIKNKKYWNQPHIIKQRSNQSKENYKNSSYVKKYKEGLRGHPNKPEKQLIELLNRLYPNEYEFCGDFSFWIELKNPDFVCRSKKKLIEFFGEYWHTSDDIKTRDEVFNRHGYECLYIWENELKDLEHVINRIKKFHER